jgi:2,3,4,5-tetrahydropyridine-2-carboxylate N-succinyltransferase
MLQSQVERLFAEQKSSYSSEDHALFEQFMSALNAGEIRAAEPDAQVPTGWRVNPWVKQGVLLGFRMGSIVDMSIDSKRQPYFDKSTFPVKQFSVESGVRIIPGGSSIRNGACVRKGVICVPPMFINIGAYVDEGTTIDSHALIGSCAQIGKKCHISAGVQIGGVLEPVGALPVIIEDEVLAGGQSGVYEGVIVKRRAVLGTGTLLNGSTPVYDLVHSMIRTASEGKPLVIPEGAVVVPGSRAVSSEQGKAWGLSLYTPVIVKYRDEKTDARIQLEDLLR